MGKLNYAGYKSDRATELTKLASLLKRAQVVQDVKPIEDASNECLTRKPDGTDKTWGYKIKDLVFQNIEDVSQIRPTILSGSFINLTLDVDFSAACVDHENHFIDSISNLNVNLVLTDQSKKFRQCWHFDRHVSESNDNAPDAAHPVYHFQSGGRHIWGYEDDFFGNVLFVEGPRIAHPPMDGILAIDFVLSNYFGKAWKNLFANTDYSNIIGAMQKKIWKPYADSFHSTWQPPTGVYQFGDPIEIYPQLVRDNKKEIGAHRKVGKKK